MGATFNNNGPMNVGRDLNQVAGDMTVGGRADGAAATPAVRVFISYRRDDTAGDAGRLHDLLTSRLGEGSVFMDVERIVAGQEFAPVIRDRIRRSDVVVVLIGPRWAGTGVGGPGRTRLFEPDDWVRQEIETALGFGVPLVPVLVRGAPMPRPTDLPLSIRRLAGFHALTIGEHWQGDVERLEAALRRSA